METLKKRLDAIQEDQLNLFEKGPDTLETVIEHWILTRKEMTLLHYARKNGVTNIGFTTVPTLQVSEIKAKEAIEMELTLKSLLASAYGTEAWTLAQATPELYHLPPDRTLKKNGSVMTVRYGTQSRVYTVWKNIYYQDDNEMWQKAAGEVDNNGAYFIRSGIKSYYINFKTEAQTLGVQSWTVEYPHILLSRESAEASSTSEPKGGTTTVPTVGRRYGRRSHSPGQTPTTGAEKRGLSIPPEDVGASHTTVTTKYRNRVERLRAEAADPPILVIKGKPNSLKCFRYRIKEQNSTAFTHVTTTFFWVGNSKDCTRYGRGRILIMFKDEGQRERFIKTVSIPRQMEYYKGSLNGI
ncbi:E2 [Boa constrictor papillomavirus 1]|uniref:E2 n=1 Tax=Boa constrictor papillomavirus 1 TaxID=2294156 RepID=UPI000E33715D|nr:E2 [Boa constrictor papillomavirus 1]AXL96271.1 E2 [Boa constrictor papillomavirus 1]